MSAAREALRDLWNRRGNPSPEQVCADITSEIELEHYRLGLLAREGLTTDAASAIARRRVELQRAKGVRGSDRP